MVRVDGTPPKEVKCSRLVILAPSSCKSLLKYFIVAMSFPRLVLRWSWLKHEKLREYIDIANHTSFEAAFEKAFQDGRASLADDVNRELAAYNRHMKFISDHNEE